MRRDIDLSVPSGIIVELQIKAETDSSLRSHLFVDDVAFVPVGATGHPVEAVSQQVNGRGGG